MLNKLMKWLRGYLLVRIQGSSPERFINLCSNRQIYLWDLIKIGEDYQFRILVKNYRKLKPIAKKTGLVPRIHKKYGLPFLLHRYRKRRGFFAGILICLIAVYMMSLFIWDIKVLGGSKYTPEAIIKFLDDKNIYSGIRKKKVNCQELEEMIRLAYNDIGWVSAEIKGTRLIVKITETNMPAPNIEATAPSHMVATKDAIIKGIITRTGTPLVKPGDVVKKGDILVSGIRTIMDDFGVVLEKQPVIASATIKCKSYYDYSDTFSMNHMVKEYTGKVKKGAYITLADKKIFLHNPSNHFSKYDIIVDENTLHVTDTFYLPFKYGKITIREYTERKETYSKEEASSIAKDRLKRYLDRLSENGVLILENNVTITIKNNVCLTEGRIIVEEPAWEYRTIDESEWRIEQIDEHNGDNH